VTSEFAGRAFSLLGVEIGLCSNYPEMLFDDEYFKGKGAYLHSLISNFNNLEEIPYSDRHDAYFVLIDDENLPFNIQDSYGTVSISGPLRRLETGSSDKRATIFGNMGIFSKYLIRILETRGIYSFHSTSFYDPKTEHLYLVLGGTGAGKSAVLLSAIDRGFEVFGTELTHASIEDGKLRFHKGSLFQNCRVGNLVEDFPRLIDKFDIKDLPYTDVWHKYVSIDFGSISTERDSLDDPKLTIIFPRIESYREVPERYKLGVGSLSQRIFENLCEKVIPPTYVFGTHFQETIDTSEDTIRRNEFAEFFVEKARIDSVWKSLANPQMCLDEIVD